MQPGDSRLKNWIMRIWTLHPKYLDARGLVALWREALLAQAVLKGQTRGYTRHPQLVRFRNAPSPEGAIAFYLQAVHAEATRRGYRFDATKIGEMGRVEPIPVTRGQFDYEWAHLMAKLRVRAPSWLADLESPSCRETHPLFQVVPGPIAEWEVTQPDNSLRR
jgi:hypothetical protein